MPAELVCDLVSPFLVHAQTFLQIEELFRQIAEVELFFISVSPVIRIRDILRQRVQHREESVKFLEQIRLWEGVNLFDQFAQLTYSARKHQNGRMV